jgi:hypothetical protein
MARKNQPQFGDDVAAPDNVSMPTLNAQQRSTTNEQAGKIKRDITRNSVVPDRGNSPYVSSWDSDGHAGLLGF